MLAQLKGQLGPRPTEVGAHLIDWLVFEGDQLPPVEEAEPGRVPRHNGDVVRKSEEHQLLQPRQVLPVGLVLCRPLVVDVRQEGAVPQVGRQSVGILHTGDDSQAGTLCKENGTAHALSGAMLRA